MLYFLFAPVGKPSMRFFLIRRIFYLLEKKYSEKEDNRALLFARRKWWPVTRFQTAF
jgi:hypothetical protein